MDTIVVNRPLSEAEIIEIKLMMENGLSVFSTSNVALPFPAEVVVQDADIKKKINYAEMENLLAFGEKMVDGIPITDRLIINGMSLWHYHKFRIYFLLRNLAYEADLALDFSKRYTKVIWYTDGPDLEVLISLPPNVECRYPVKSKHQKKDIASKIKFAVYVKIRFLQGVISSFKKEKVKHLLIDRSAKQPCLNLNTLELEPENYNLAYILANAGNDFTVIDEIEMPQFGNGKPFRFREWMFVNTRKPLGRIPGEYILVKALFSMALWKAFRKADKLAEKRIAELDTCFIAGREAWILRRLRQFHPASRLYIFKNLAYCEFFKNKNYLSITTIDENSPALRSILDAARKFKIKTIGIQHGNIHDLHPAYMLTEADISRNMICDTTIVWGEYWKNFLITKAYYPERRLFIAGQPRTDIIPLLREKQNELSDKFNIPKGDIVVFASQLQQDQLLRERAAFDVFEAARQFENVHFIIKLHPSEVADPGYYVRIAEQVGCRNYSVTNKNDLYLLIATCRLLITCFSTVGAETIYFGKPLVILDHLDQDIQGFIRQKVAFKARNAGELTEIIAGILDGNLIPDEGASSDFINRNAFRIDGRTSRRILDFICQKG